jgi:tight adherence protein B
MTPVLLVALLLGVLAAAEAVYYFVRYLNDRQVEELRRRLRTTGTEAASPIRRRRRMGSGVTSDVVAGLPFTERLENLLDQTDSTMTVAGLLLRMLGLALLGALVSVLVQRPLLAIVLVPALGIVPVLGARYARGARARKISAQLPDAVDMMARALKAGHALPACFRLVAQETSPPLATEFAKAYEQQNLGLPLEAAVLGMTERVPASLDLKLLAVSVNIQGETGGNLVEVLERMAETMRERFKFYSKLRTLTAEARLSGVVLGSLPFLVALVVAVSNPGYLTELGHGLGRSILVGAILAWTLGILWIRQLAKVVY